MNDRNRPAPRPVPVMTQEQRRQARREMTPEERREADAPMTADEVRRLSEGMKKGGIVKKMAKGGMVRGDGACSKGKTKGRMV